jgi:hypothetical protein
MCRDASRASTSIIVANNEEIYRANFDPRFVLLLWVAKRVFKNDDINFN